MFNKGIRSVGVLALLTSSLSCGGGYSVAYREGHKAEQKKDWDTALVDYEKAREADPANSLYIIHETLARSNATALHFRTGQQMLKDGRTEEAAGEFQKAVRIDPTNRAAQQQLDVLLRKQASTKKSHTEALQKALKDRAEASQPTELKLQPFPTGSADILSHFKVAADSRRVFETLGKLAGLNVAFTPDFRPS